MKTKTKIKLTLLWFGLFLTSLRGISFASYDVEFNWLADIFKNKLVWVHFKWWGNDFGWMMFVTKLKDLNSSEEISLSPSQKISWCKKQLRWYYWSALWGWVIYPLDEQTLNFWKWVNSSFYNGLQIEGGLYTACDGDPTSIYWQIIYKKNWKIIFALNAGFKYDVEGNTINWSSGFANSFQIYDWKTIGLIYDSRFGIGFVGGKVVTKWKDVVNYLNDHKVSKFVTNLTETAIENEVGANIIPIYWEWLDPQLAVRWLMNLYTSKFSNNQQLYTRLTTNKYKTVVLNWKILNISRVLNDARRKVEKICQWQWEEIDWSYNKIIWIESKWKTICLKWDGWEIIVNVDLTDDGDVTNIFVKWQNNKVIIKKSQTGPGYVNIFVDNWYVMFSNSINLLPINGEGNIDATNTVTSGAVFNGNVLVNWLVVWTDNDNLTWFKHKLYWWWSLASLNTVWENQSRQKYVGSFLWSEAKNYVDITKVFKWQCLDDGKWTDWVNCSDPNDKYGFVSFIIQKANYKRLW